MNNISIILGEVFYLAKQEKHSAGYLAFLIYDKDIFDFIGEDKNLLTPIVQENLDHVGGFGSKTVFYFKANKIGAYKISIGLKQPWDGNGKIEENEDFFIQVKENN